MIKEIINTAKQITVMMAQIQRPRNGFQSHAPIRMDVEAKPNTVKLEEDRVLNLPVQISGFHFYQRSNSVSAASLFSCGSGRLSRLPRFLPFTVFVLLFFGESQLVGQSSYRDSVSDVYEKRITLSHINGVYIPKDVKDALRQLDNLIDEPSKEKYKSVPEEEAARKLHFSFGLWMIVNWGFYEGSRLSHYLRSMGISYPDDMARALMICYHRQLNGKPLGMEELASFFSKKRKEELEKRLQQGEVIQTEPVKNKP